MRRALIAAAAVLSVLAHPADTTVSPALAAAPSSRASPVVVEPASAADFQRASTLVLDLARTVAAQPGAAPAMSVVLVRKGQPPVVWTQGRLSADGDAPASDDSPFYIASQTKAFIGLLAVKLDAQGVFDLDQSLADIWPDLVLPQGADPAAITFRDMLNHQGPFETQPLSFRTAYSDRVPSSDYPRLMAEAASARPPGYRYSNLGYLVYGAALEAKTGSDWRDLIEQELFAPAGMNRSGARPSRFAGDLPRYHRWMGDRGWDVFGGKPDDLMHAAGGLVMSPNDMARWLSLQLGEPNAAVRPEWLALARAAPVAAPTEGGFDCQTYALGWHGCRLGAVDVLTHGGGYTGMRSAMAVSPELGVGLAFFSNSDSLTGALSQELVRVFFESLQDPSWQAPAVEAFGQDYARRVAAFARRRMDQVDSRTAEARWAGWGWKPEAADRASYAGRFRHPTMGEFVVDADSETIKARLGVVEYALRPAAPDLFGLSDGPADPPAPVLFEREQGRVVRLIWDDQRFERVD